MDYSIQNTTRKQREELVKSALAISLSGAEEPTSKTMKLVRQYIDGKKELEEVQKEITNQYQHGTTEL